MTDATRADRLRTDFKALVALKSESTIFDFEPTGDPPDRYLCVFQGKGLARDVSSPSGTEVIQVHRCEVRLPFSYPERGPDIRWLTPIFHPNVSFSGWINLHEIGLPWDKQIPLVAVCERLWDIARMAYVNWDKATAYAAKNWFQKECTLRLPLDPRPLRDKQAASGSSNVVRYERLGEKKVTLPQAADADVLFIREDTPTPEIPQRPLRPRRIASKDDDDILFIGE